jgi:hypothetical protein
MNWFRQNRSLGLLLIALGICVLAGGILFYWTRTKWIDAKQGFDRAVAERSRLQHLDPFPNDANYQKLQVDLKNYGAALDKFKDELKTEMAPAPPLPPNVFQSHLRQATIATLNRARANKIKFPDNFRLGFDEFATAMPKTALAPLLGQELSQIQMLVNILLDAKVDSVTSFHRAPLSEERGASATPKPTPVAARRGSAARGPKAAVTVPGSPDLIERDIIDITFKAAPAAARKVLNEISSSKGQFYIIRTLYVRNEKDKGPPREKIAEPNPAAAQTPAPSPSGNAALNFIVGNEHIEVTAKVEMLRFTF